MSTQDNDREALESFFSGYFHEDWVCDAASPAAVVASYLETATASEVSRLHDAVVRYAQHENDDVNLEGKLFSELGCYYRPKADGISARDWLFSVAALLAAKAKN